MAEPKISECSKLMAELADHARLIDVNLKGIINGSYTATRIFIKQRYGTVINLGSIDSEVPLAYQGSYAASKAGVRSLGESLKQELRLAHHDSVKVVTIEPWERFTANVAHKYQIENALPAPNTDGNLFKPMPTGTGVDDGVRERMKKEDEERNQIKNLKKT
jgi:NADP-dependent 3-hydroxy acid dehydrogenase YdfG